MVLFSVYMHYNLQTRDTGKVIRKDGIYHESKFIKRINRGA